MDMNKDRIIEALNVARSMELHAIHQYMNHHYKLDDQEYGELAKVMQLIAIDEMKHAESFAERISELGGTPAVTQAGQVTKNHTVKDMYSFDVNEEVETVSAYEKLKAICVKYDDAISIAIFDKIIADEIKHKEYFASIDAKLHNPSSEDFLNAMIGTSSSIGEKKGYVLDNETKINEHQ